MSRVREIVLVALVAHGLTGCDTLSGLLLTAAGITDGDNQVAKSVAFNGDRASVTGTIYPFGDYDIYQLGAFNLGDTLNIDNTPTFLRAGFLLIDGTTETVIDGFDGYSPNRSGADVVLRQNVADLQLWVGPGHTRRWPVRVIPFPMHGPYHITIRKTGVGTAIPAPSRQTLILDFNGGAVMRYYNAPINLDPFDAADYGLAGQDAALHTGIRDRVDAIFQDFDVRIITSDDPPPAGPASRVYFTKPGFFDVAGRNIAAGQVRYFDFRNRDAEDVAIVSMSGRLFQSLTGAAGSFGHVAAHEIGHLLGLLHQEQGLMSYRSSNDIISGPLVGYFGFVAGEDQTMLFPPVPVLNQPAREMLFETVGPR